MVGQGEDSVESAEEEEEPLLPWPRLIVLRLILFAVAGLIFAGIDFYYLVFLPTKAILGALLD